MQQQPSAHELRPSSDQLQGNIFPSSRPKNPLLTYSEGRNDGASERGSVEFRPEEGKFGKALALNCECSFCHLRGMFTGDEWRVVHVLESHDAQPSVSQRLEALQSLHVVR